MRVKLQKFIRILQLRRNICALAHTCVFHTYWHFVPKLQSTLSCILCARSTLRQYEIKSMQSLGFSYNLFLLGVWGIFLNRKNIILLLMAIELMLLAVNYNFVVSSVLLDDLTGQIFALLVLTVAAAESAIGLALLMIYYRVRGSISIDFIRLLKG